MNKYRNTHQVRLPVELLGHVLREILKPEPKNYHVIYGNLLICCM